MIYRRAGPPDAGAVARVQVASWRTTYAGLLPEAVLAGLSVAVRMESWSRQLEAANARTRERGLIAYVAEDSDGQVVGFASGGPEREAGSGFDAELYAVYLLAEYQAKGAGRALVGHVVSDLRRQGYVSMRVWVLEGNAAERFYQHLGGQYVEDKTVEIGGEIHRELAYGWMGLDGVA